MKKREKDWYIVDRRSERVEEWEAQHYFPGPSNYSNSFNSSSNSFCLVISFPIFSSPFVLPLILFCSHLLFLSFSFALFCFSSILSRRTFFSLSISRFSSSVTSCRKIRGSLYYLRSLLNVGFLFQKVWGKIRERERRKKREGGREGEEDRKREKAILFPLPTLFISRLKKFSLSHSTSEREITFHKRIRRMEP